MVLTKDTAKLLQGKLGFCFFFLWGLNLSRTVFMGSVMLLVSIWQLGRRCWWVTLKNVISGKSAERLRHKWDG